MLTWPLTILRNTHQKNYNNTHRKTSKLDVQKVNKYINKNKILKEAKSQPNKNTQVS